MRARLVCAVVLAGATVAATGTAQETAGLGSRGQFVVGAERLFGYYSWSQESSASGLTGKVQGSNFSFLVQDPFGLHLSASPRRPTLRCS